MRTVYVVEPDGWPCTLADCPPGFFMFQGSLELKTEYTDEYGSIIAYCESGEVFWGGLSDFKARGALVVQPVLIVKRDE